MTQPSAPITLTLEEEERKRESFFSAWLRKKKRRKRDGHVEPSAISCHPSSRQKEGEKGR